MSDVYYGRLYKNFRRKTIETKSINEVNALREEVKIPLLEQKIRDCLKCEKSFTSEGFNNRLCHACGAYADRTGVADYAIHL